MKALLKSNTWVEIDTKHLFKDQYITIDGERIFDKDIIKIVDDVRGGLGKCRYCGKIVKKGEEEKHFKEEEAKGCIGCWWFREVYKGMEEVEEKQKAIADSQGNKTIEKYITLKKIYKIECTYNNGTACNCSLKEHRARGIEWFTPDNTFFLAYPDGLPLESKNTLTQKGFDLTGNYTAKYSKKIGTYDLTASINGDRVEYFQLWNCRNNYRFRIVNGAIYTNECAFGWRKVKTLKNVPDKVIKEVREILE